MSLARCEFDANLRYRVKLSTNKQKQGMRKTLLVEEALAAACQPEFNPQDPHGRRRKRLSSSLLMSM